MPQHYSNGRKKTSSTITKEKKFKAASMMPGKVKIGGGSAKERMKKRGGYKKPSDNPNNSGRYSY